MRTFEVGDIVEILAAAGEHCPAGATAIVVACGVEKGTLDINWMPPVPEQGGTRGKEQYYRNYHPKADRRIQKSWVRKVGHADV